MGNSSSSSSSGHIRSIQECALQDLQTHQATLSSISSTAAQTSFTFLLSAAKQHLLCHNRPAALHCLRRRTYQKLLLLQAEDLVKGVVGTLTTTKISDPKLLHLLRRINQLMSEIQQEFSIATTPLSTRSFSASTPSLLASSSSITPTPSPLPPTKRRSSSADSIISSSRPGPAISGGTAGRSAGRDGRDGRSGGSRGREKQYKLSREDEEIVLRCLNATERELFASISASTATSTFPTASSTSTSTAPSKLHGTDDDGRMPAGLDVLEGIREEEIGVALTIDDAGGGGEKGPSRMQGRDGGNGKEEAKRLHGFIIPFLVVTGPDDVQIAPWIDCGFGD